MNLSANAHDGEPGHCSFVRLQGGISADEWIVNESNFESMQLMDRVTHSPDSERNFEWTRPSARNRFLRIYGRANEMFIFMHSTNSHGRVCRARIHSALAKHREGFIAFRANYGVDVKQIRHSSSCTRSWLMTKRTRLVYIASDTCTLDWLHLDWFQYIGRGTATP